MEPIWRKSLDRNLAALMAVIDPNESLSKGFGAYHSGQLAQQVPQLNAGRLLEAYTDVLALYLIPLKIQNLTDAIAKTVRDDEDPGGKCEPRHRKKRLHRFAFDVAHCNPKCV